MLSAERTYVFTDVHGCADALEGALAWIKFDSSGFSARIIGLGDYVDRGPDPRAVIEQLHHLQSGESDDLDVVFLKGNHEDMMVMAHRDPARMRDWITQGGETTMNSFGGEIPKDVLEWCNAFPYKFEDEYRYYVHAGFRPGVPANDQVARDCMWIRGEFLNSENEWGKVVVHGHTPVDEPTLLPGRINLDTGRVFGGKLTVARWVGDDPKPLLMQFS